MDQLTLAVVSRNYFNLPCWIALHAGLFAAEGLEVRIDHIEGIEEVNDRLRDGRAQLAYGVTEHVILDAEAGGSQRIIGGNVNRLPFSFIASAGIADYAGLRGKRIGVSSLRAGSSSLIIRLLARHGVFVITAAISPYAETRGQVRALAAADGIPFVEAFVNPAFESLVRRDVKGLYKRALAGEIPHFTGVSDPYEPPADPDVEIRTDAEPIEASVGRVLAVLVGKGILPAKNHMIN